MLPVNRLQLTIAQPQPALDHTANGAGAANRFIWTATAAAPKTEKAAALPSYSQAFAVFEQCRPAHPRIASSVV